jgi:RNA polymerase sigma-70 factor (ECF subfamily)
MMIRFTRGPPTNAPFHSSHKRRLRRIGVYRTGEECDESAVAVRVERQENKLFLAMLIREGMRALTLIPVLNLEYDAPRLKGRVRVDDAIRVAALFDAHHLMLWRFALRMTSNPAVAEDLIQETFLRAIERINRLPESEVSARAWLCQTLVNLCRDRYRRRAVRERYKARIPGVGERVSDPEQVMAARQSFDRAIGELPARRRAILVLHELEGMDIGGVAAVLGLRPPTVRWHLAAARRHLERTLGRG